MKEKDLNEEPGTGEGAGYLWQAGRLAAMSLLNFAFASC